MLNAASRESLAVVRERVEARGNELSDRGEVASALFAVADVLAGAPGLRRSVAEASTPVGDRTGLVRRLFGGRISDSALEVLVEVVGQRWSAPWDLVDAVEGAGNQLLLQEAESAGHLDAVEDQLFRFGRIVAGDDALRAALDDRAQAPRRRAELARTLLAGRADPVTVALVSQAVASTAHASTELAVDDLLEVTAARRDRSVAAVTSAVELTGDQVDRLAAALTRLYGRPITVRVAVEPSLRGGLVVRVGDEVIDGSVASRLAAARGALEQ